MKLPAGTQNWLLSALSDLGSFPEMQEEGPLKNGLVHAEQSQEPLILAQRILRDVSVFELKVLVINLKFSLSSLL